MATLEYVIIELVANHHLSVYGFYPCPEYIYDSPLPSSEIKTFNPVVTLVLRATPQTPPHFLS